MSLERFLWSRSRDEFSIENSRGVAQLASALGSGPRGRRFKSARPDHSHFCMDKCLHVYYSGSVQGVGFRFTAERIAASLGLSGWVRNLRDGRVEVTCEGEESDLKEFLRKMEDMFKDYIRDIDAEWSNTNDDFKGFDIRF